MSGNDLVLRKRWPSPLLQRILRPGFHRFPSCSCATWGAGADPECWPGLTPSAWIWNEEWLNYQDTTKQCLSLNSG